MVSLVGSPPQGLQGDPVEAQLPPEEVTQGLRPILPGVREVETVEDVGQKFLGGSGKEGVGGDPSPSILHLLVRDGPEAIEDLRTDPGAPADTPGQVGVLAPPGMGDLEEETGAGLHGRGKGRGIYQDSY
jgi:hypothetical protein